MQLNSGLTTMRRIIGLILLATVVVSPVYAYGADVLGQEMVLQPNDLLPGWQGTPGEMVPESYWSQAIRKLKPIRVFVDRVNIAVVTSEDETHQSGVYIVTVISSYVPTDKAGREFVWDNDANLLRFKFAKK